MSKYRFFKYRAIDKHFIDSLVKGALHFSLPEKLNDPFDCNIDVKRAIANGMESLDEEYAGQLNKLKGADNPFRNLARIIKKVGICSFSRLNFGDLKSTLLWSHYANGHKGACVLYEFPKLFLDEGESFVGVANVTYEQNPFANWFLSVTQKQMPMEYEKFSSEFIKKILTVKSPPWKYEKEARIIRKKAGAFRIPKSFIKQICFGLNTPQEDVELIREIADGFEHKLHFSRVFRSDSDFGTEVRDI